MESNYHSHSEELYIGIDIGGTKCAVVAGESIGYYAALCVAIYKDKF